MDAKDLTFVAYDCCRFTSHELVSEFFIMNAFWEQTCLKAKKKFSTLTPKIKPQKWKAKYILLNIFTQVIV